ncbi:MAG: DUF4347 domain-containing protein [Limnospira sp.]
MLDCPSQIAGKADIPESNLPPISQLLVIDRSVTDTHLFRDALLTNIPVAFIDRRRDGVRQITDILTHYSHLHALHILSHGSPGTLHLGDADLNSRTLERYRSQLQQWGRAFGETAEILIYACEVALGARGFLSRLGRAIGANIAASSTKIGNCQLGGNWELDIKWGNITTPLPFSLSKLAAYPGVLATYNANTVDELINAIETANGTTENDAIELSPGTYTLTEVNNTTSDGFDSNPANGLPVVAANPDGGALTINGNGAVIERDTTALDFRFFYVQSNSTLTLNDLTFQNGSAGGRGGAIYVSSTLGNLTINDSTFYNNFLAGGPSEGGGALFVYYSSNVTINNSTFSGNSTEGSGGAIYNVGNLFIANSTFTDNTADTENGNDSETYDNGGAIFQNAGTATLKNTLISGNIDNSTETKHPDISGGTWVDGGNNLIGDITGETTLEGASAFTNNSLVGTADDPLDAYLDVLADNGGLSQTHALLGRNCSPRRHDRYCRRHDDPGRFWRGRYRQFRQQNLHH